MEAKQREARPVVEVHMYLCSRGSLSQDKNEVNSGLFVLFGVS